MKKLKLRIECLRVEQFETQADSTAARGTVHGLESGALTAYGCGVSASEPAHYCLEMPFTWSCDAPC